MKIRTIVTATTLASAAILAGYVGSVQADLPKIAPALTGVAPVPAPPILRRAAPLALPVEKRIVRMNQALKLANLSASPPQTLEMRVTPMAPRQANGAEITRAGPMTQFLGVVADEPDGSYALHESYITAVELKFPTEANKLYILDCRVQPYKSKVIIVLRHVGNNNYPAIDDGHAMHAFQAASASTAITVAFEATPDAVKGGSVGYFYGCDFGKAN